MKKIMTIGFIGVFIFCAGLIHVNMAWSGWVANIHAQGQDLAGVNEYDVFIGIDMNAETAEAPPEPPDYSVKMELREPDIYEGPFSKHIQKRGESVHRWIISINPHGNIPPPTARTSTISWDPSAFGPGDIKLVEGSDDAGVVVVPDMKAVESYEVTGEQGNQNFLIVYTLAESQLSLFTLADAIGILQILAGGPDPGFSFNADMNSNGKTDLAEAIHILRKVAGL